METCKSVLIVEDNSDLREVIEEALTLEGITVKSAKNGKEALAALKLTKEPVLIFLDLMMPVMNGWELLDEIKKDKNLVKHRVITISAVSPTQSLESPARLLVDGNVQKPLSWDGIWNEVQKYC